VLIYLLLGSLPWQGLKGKTKQDKHNKIMDYKLANTPEEICKGFPDCFSKYFQYCTSLQFDEKPDYQMLNQMFKDEMDVNRYSFDYQFDWVKIWQVKY
jgi:casein kinase 1